MPSNEKQRLEKALGLDLDAVSLDWPQFKKDYGIQHDDPADDAADRAFFTWQRFRGEHRPQSCLLDDEERVRGLIIKGTDLKNLRLPALPALEYLCVCENEQLVEIELEGAEYPLLQYVDWSNNALKRVELTAELPLLRYLSLRKNGIEALCLPPSLPNLEELDASENRLEHCELPKGLDALQYLFLRKNGMKSLRTEARLSKLRTLHLVENQLTDLPRAEYTQLETLYLEGNPLAGFGETLIKGDKSGNAVEIIAALRSFAQTGERPNHRARLIIVGNGRTGKTCLLKRIKGLPCDRREIYTHGIAISELGKTHLPGVKTDELILKVWDFGGQEVFYATHQFFMSEEAAYVYAWTDQEIARKNWEDDEQKPPRANHQPDKWRSHEYWLDNIRMHGKESPVVVVKTHCLDTRGTFPAERLKDAYALKHDPVDFDAFSPEPRYLENLAKAMIEALNQLPLLGQPIPKGFQDLVGKMDELRADGTVELQWADFVPLAEACQIPAADADAALGYLRKTGEVIHFPDSPRLHDKIYVNPGVLTERAYKLIESNDDLTRQEGKFSAAYAQKILGADWEDLLELLISFQLIYREETGGGVSYIAPQYLLPLPREDCNARSSFLGHEMGKPLRFTLRYPQFLPENVMVNVLSEYGPYALGVVYRDAIFFCKKGQTEGCVIKVDEEKREIYVHTTPTLAGDVLAKEVFEQFVALSKKAALHIAVKAGEWVDVKPLQNALSTDEITTLTLVSGDGFARLADFSFLQQERGSTFNPTQAYNQYDKPSTTSDMKETIRNLVAQGRLKEALAALEKWKPDETILLQQRYEQMNKGERLGTWTSAEINVERNKIANAILELASEINVKPERGSNVRADNSDFGSLLAVRALSETRDINLDDDVTPSKTYPKHPESIIRVPMVRDISNGAGWQITPDAPIEILFTAATPSNTTKLNTGKESRLKDLIREFDEEKRISFSEEHGLNVDQFRRLLFTKDPHIIHFAGHGQREGLVLEEDHLDADVLVGLVAELENTRIVVLNACYTLPLAQQLAQYVPFVVGTQGPIPDDAAIAFAYDFYTGLAAGKSVEKSFAFGLNGIKSKRLPGADIPILVIGDSSVNT